MEYVIYL